MRKKGFAVPAVFGSHARLHWLGLVQSVVF